MQRKQKQKKWRIRNAAFRDAPAIYRLIKQHPREVLPRSISDIVQNTDRFVVAETDNGDLVGTASWQILPELGRVQDPAVEIKSVSVAPDFQGKGVGAALIRAVIRKIKVHRPHQLVVLTFSPDYFRKFGFQEVPKEQLMHKLYAGCVNCTKYDSPFTCPERAMVLPLRKPAQTSD